LYILIKEPKRIKKQLVFPNFLASLLATRTGGKKIRFAEDTFHWRHASLKINQKNQKTKKTKKTK
jgi:hypothetical protein